VFWSETMGPSRTELRYLVPLTAATTFVAGVFAAQGHMIVFVGMLVIVALAWVVAAVRKIGA
jgi:hypothetical protein